MAAGLALLLAGAPLPCDPALTVGVPVGEIAASPEQWRGQCVRTRGLMRGHSLYADADALYRRPLRWDDPSSNGFRIGLIGTPTPDGDTIRAVTLVGRVGNCAEIAEEARVQSPPDAIVMLSGYCHYQGGTVLLISAVEADATVRPERRLPARAASDFGDLTPIAPTSPWRQRFGRAAETVSMLLQRGDDAALAVLAQTQPGQPAPPETLAILRGEGGSPFAALRGTRRNIGIEVFGWRPPLWADTDYVARQQDDPRGEAVACFSTVPDIARRWPIAVQDADNRPERPYACLRILYDASTSRESWRIEVDQARDGLAEPR